MNDGRLLILLLATAAGLLCSRGAPAACSTSSAADRPHLVELYTSEGCDSCPPAERWMSTLRKHADLIGLEFHVDYWDNADWRDPFSDHAYTVRQQTLAARGGRDQVYTPQVWVDGRVWTNWPKAAPPQPVAAQAPPLRLTAEADDTLRVSLAGDSSSGRYRAYVALSESDLSEHVRGGENRGKTLRHDEVVRALAGPLALPQAQAELKISPRIERENASVVAFVEDPADGSVVQALRIPLKECTR